MITAEQVMTKEVISVKRDTPIREAMHIMLANSISGLPVVDDDMTLVGILSEKDVVSLAYNIIYQTDNLEKKKVCNFMTERAVSFSKDENFLDVCDFLAKNLFRRVPITSKGKLVGIISITDIIEYTLKLIREREDADASADLL